MEEGRVKHLIRSAALVCTIALSSTASAGYLVIGAAITKIENTYSNQASFVVNVQGGTGPCAGTYTIFPVSAAVDADAHKRAYAAAMMAFAMGMRVSIFNYTDDSCSGAAYISVYP